MVVVIKNLVGDQMKTGKRLALAYDNASIIEFDEKSKFIIFGDVHRGDNSMSDEFAHNQNIYYFALKQYFNEGYTYIEVGDGDELWEHSKFSHIRSAHSDVFSMLSDFYMKDRLIMLYGNHNMILKKPQFVERYLYKYYDEYYNEEGLLFPQMKVQESIVLKYIKTGQEFLTLHGHQGDLMNDQLWKISMLSLRYFWRFMHIIGFQNPSSPAKNRVKRHKIEVNFTKWIEKEKINIICGHTHRPKFPNIGDAGYFNTGCCIHPRGITGIEIEDGKIMLVDWRVRPNEDGELRIRKNIIRGPEPIENYS